MVRQALRNKGVRDLNDRVTVDENALIITRWHQIANQLREEARGDAKHGSCGQGVGECAKDALEMPDLVIRAKDLLLPETFLADKLERYRAAKWERLVAEGLDEYWAFYHQGDTYNVRPDHIAGSYREWTDTVTIVGSDYLEHLGGIETVIFEGAQGVLLDENFGFHPYTTWSTTTPENAFQLIAENGLNVDVTSYGVMRTYMTRHGAGPFPSQTDDFQVEEPHNGTGQWQGEFRQGYLDLVLLRYAVDVCRGLIDEIVLTHVDKTPSWKAVIGYLLPGYTDNDDFLPDGSFVCTRIKMSERGMLQRQERLGELLQTAVPVVNSTQTDSYRRLNDIVAAVEKKLELPVTLVSDGPAATSKHEINTSADGRVA